MSFTSVMTEFLFSLFNGFLYFITRNLVALLIIGAFVWVFFIWLKERKKKKKGKKRNPL